MGVQNTCLMIGEPKQFHGFSRDSCLSSLSLSSKGEVTSGVKLRWGCYMGQFTTTIFSATEQCHFDATFLRGGLALFQYCHPKNRRCKSSRVTSSPHTRTHQFAMTRSLPVDSRRQARGGAWSAKHARLNVTRKT